MNHWTDRTSWTTAAFLALCWGLTAASPAAELRYQSEAGYQFAYEFTIKVDLPDKVTTYKGVTRYSVKSSAADQIQLTYRGGLTESNQGKATGNRRGGFPPGAPFGPGFRPSGPPDPFSRPAFAGKVQTTNEITLSTRGGVLAMKGDSQLPYLLGNVSLLPFEVLPAGNERQWSFDSGVSIEQKDESSRSPFGRFGPFARQEGEQTQAGEEGAEYVIEKEDAEKVVVKKTYRLKTPAVKDEPAFEMTGTGNWTFNRMDQLPGSLDFNMKLLISGDNSQTTVPISIAYRRLSADAVAKMDQEAQQRLKEQELKVAKEKQQAEAPLSPDEKQAHLAALASNDQKAIGESLKALRGKSPKEPDSEIAAAIARLMNHPATAVRDGAKSALAKWSPEFARKQTLNAAYTSHMPVESTDREVNSTTPLYVGQIVQFQEHGSFWHAGEIEGLEPDGKVTVRDRGFTKRVRTLARKNIQLAPDELEQPKRPADATTITSTTAAPVPTTSTGMRTWLDATGEHRIEAVFLGLADGKVMLKRADGKEIAVPLDKLSKPDQKFAQEQPSAKKSSNPFEP